MHDAKDVSIESERPPRNVLRILVRVLVILVALGLLVSAGAGTLMGFAGRDNWRMELFCHFRVQYFWLLVLAAGFFGAVRQRILMLVAAALAATNLVLILPLYFGSGGEPQTSSSTIRATSLNVYFANHDHQSAVDFVLREQPDFAFFFEVTPGWAESLAQLNAKYPYSEVIPRNDPTGIALFSKHKIADIQIEPVSPLALPTIVAGLEMPQGRLTVIGTHPASPRSETDFRERNQALEEVAEIAAARSGPVALLGDLNTTSWSPHFQDLVKVSGLRDSRYGFGVEPTWPWLPLPLRIPIDHCLVSPEITILNRRVGPSVGSDHRPIVVDFAY